MDAVNLAWKARNEALKNLRFKRAVNAYFQVLKTDEQLVQAVAAKRTTPPNPKQNFTYGGIAYCLQSYQKGNARYVRTENFNPEEYVYEHPDMVQRVRDELGITAEVEYEIEMLREFFPDIAIESL